MPDAILKILQVVQREIPV